MRKFAVSIFIGLYLLANTELHELVKLGFFVQHYAQHRTENPDLGLIDFIIIHYFSGNIMDDDYDQDMRLPFKTPDYFGLAAPSHTLPQPIFLPLMPPGVSELSVLLIYDQSKLPSSHLSDIWQPPKAC